MQISCQKKIHDFWNFLLIYSISTAPIECIEAQSALSSLSDIYHKDK